MMMKRILVLLSLVVPIGLLGFAALFPASDVTLHEPLLHFYIVTFFTFAAAVIAFFTAAALGTDSAPRHRLLAMSFAVMGALFLVHGATTPGALIFTSNPGVQWAAWLTLLVGGVVFAFAGWDRPERPLSTRHFVRIQWGLGLFYLLFVLIVVFEPGWLTAVNQLAAPLHQRLVFGSTLLVWLYAAARLTQTWRQTGDQVDGVMALIAAWIAIGSVSLHQFALWHISWWIYHVQLLLGAITAVGVLGQRYEQLRRFRLTAYVAAAGLIVTAALTLLSSHLFAQIVERRLEAEISQQGLRVGQNLAVSFLADMPEATTGMELRQMAGETRLFQSATWAARLAGLEIGAVIVYDGMGTAVYPDTLPPLPSATNSLMQAMQEGATTRIFMSETPLYEGATADHYLQTFVPLTSSAGTVGVISTVQALPDLVPAVVAARLSGLLIAGLLMGLLYLGMLIIVQRADRLISARNQELAQAYADLQAAEMMRDELTDMLVHDLRSPLTSVSLSLDLLEKTLEDPDKAMYRPRFFRGARDSLQQMLALINQLLDVARLEAGQLKLEPTTFAIAELLQEKAARFTLQAETAGKQLRVNVDDALPSVQADRELVGRVLDNLIGNALKHTRSGGHITLCAATNGPGLVLHVADTGEGIPAEAAVHIFDKFYQVRDAQGKPVRRGTGLGLSFCKLVVEAHNGRIWVESQPGQGSTFSFTLPLANA
ncbi:MAG: HAMP domain-containing sensor histidine kinase [Chloroflexota bacterium]|nr:HAMP domain-containing histidine kinase [Ardenticatenaceae bacterium]